MLKSIGPMLHSFHRKDKNANPAALLDEDHLDRIRVDDGICFNRRAKQFFAGVGVPRMTGFTLSFAQKTRLGRPRRLVKSLALQSKAACRARQLIKCGLHCLLTLLRGFASSGE